MLPLGIAWVVTSPYLVALSVAQFGPLNRFVARSLPLPSIVGWTALATLAAVVFTAASATIALIAAPLVGLAFWVRRPGDDGDDGQDPEPEPSPGEPRVTVRLPQRPRPARPAPPRVRGGRAPSRTGPRRSSRA